MAYQAIHGDLRVPDDYRAPNPTNDTASDGFPLDRRTAPLPPRGPTHHRAGQGTRRPVCPSEPRVTIDSCPALRPSRVAAWTVSSFSGMFAIRPVVTRLGDIACIAFRRRHARMHCARNACTDRMALRAPPTSFPRSTRTQLAGWQTCREPLKPEVQHARPLTLASRPAKQSIRAPRTQEGRREDAALAARSRSCHSVSQLVGRTVPPSGQIRSGIPGPQPEWCLRTVDVAPEGQQEQRDPSDVCGRPSAQKVADNQNARQLGPCPRAWQLRPRY